MILSFKLLRLQYLLTQWSRLLEKLTGFAAKQEIPRILWIPKVMPPLETLPPPGDHVCNTIYNYLFLEYLLEYILFVTR